MGGDSIGVGFGIGIAIDVTEMSFGHGRNRPSTRRGVIDTDPDTDSDPEGDQPGAEVPNEALRQTGATGPIGKRARLVSAPAASL